MADVQAQIASLKRRVNELTNAVNTCIRQANALLSRQRNLENRLRELQDIRAQATSGLNGYSDDANSEQTKLVRALEYSVIKHAHVSELMDQVSRDSEPSFSADRYGWEAVGSIDREIHSVQQELDSTIRQKNGQNTQADNTRRTINSLNRQIQDLQRQQMANG